MLINEVALGNCKDMCTHDMTLTSPPEGHNSVHGVRRCDGVQSEFEVSGLYFVVFFCCEAIYIQCKWHVNIRLLKDIVIVSCK